MIILPFVGCLPESVGLGYTTSLPFLPVFISLVVENLSASLQAILMDSRSVK